MYECYKYDLYLFTMHLECVRKVVFCPHQAAMERAVEHRPYPSKNLAVGYKLDMLEGKD
jgi:hypothetical protein